MKHMVTQLLFAAALALVSASAAQAFTFEGTAPGDGGGVQRNYTDPDEQMKPKVGAPQRFDDQSQSGAQKDGFYLNFGGQTQSFDQKYNSNDYFNPLKR
jgi:opacity protein-like surface antigen